MSDPEETLLKTPLYDLHCELGGRMVPFAGYAMPVQYPAGIMGEHKHCRAAAALFDVSHMGQVRVTGAQAEAALEALMPVDLATLAPGQQRYTFFTNDSAGILDDLMVAREDEGFFLVVNAACKAADFAHLQQGLGKHGQAEMLEGLALLALQGPQAAAVLSRFAPGVETLKFMGVAEITVEGLRCRVTRSGYTGEDGYEISVAAGEAEALARRLLAESEVMPAGLGARDSLRLEAGLCLYGHDIDETTTPVEAGLIWAIQKRRRSEGGFPGDAVIQAQIAEGAGRKRVGLRPTGRAPVREGAEILDEAGEAVGRVTSGGFGPSVEAPVAMGYLPSELTKPGTEVSARVRNRTVDMEVAKMPFQPHNYFRG
ncbi:glycine cleavage system aminomethyltransferase GcvT [Aquibaculum sediminis]|uniref:glycine cleavage system aminomethyltransferase GcvT n=1 Tax=Aquibaculum sediminis TaxID=3231907 RepID=UPI0034514376